MAAGIIDIVIGATLVVASALVLPALAEQRTLYKSVLPSGEVVYADAPHPNARRAEALSVEPHAPDAQATEAAQRDLSVTRERLMRDADARVARREQLDRNIAEASDQLRNAQVRREQGREVQEGDRQGRRLVGPFWQRQQALEEEVLRTRHALDALLRARAAL